MADKPAALDLAAFLDSPQARALALPTAALRRIAELFVKACYEGLGKAPWTIDGEDLRIAVTQELPARMSKSDPLAEHVEAVVGAFIDHLSETHVVHQAFELHRALDQHAAESREVVDSGRLAGRVADETKPFVHGASKLGRNDPCSCGSGKKFKKCHGKDT